MRLFIFLNEKTKTHHEGHEGHKKLGKTLRVLCFSILLLLAAAVLDGCNAYPASASGHWVKRASMQGQRSWIGIAEVGGQIYAIGGMVGADGRKLDSSERYDPRTDSWTFLAAMPTPRSSLAVVPVGNTIYAIGGYGVDGPTDRLEAYDVTADRWTTDLPPMPTKRYDLTAVVLDNIIYAIGGNTKTDLNTVEAFDTVTRRWTRLAPLITSRYALQSIAINGLVYVLGGRSNGVLTDVVEVFNPKTQTWSFATRMPEPMAGFGVATADGILHVVKFDKHFAYDLRSNRWQSNLPPMPTSRQGLQLATIDGVIYALGGCSEGAGNLFDVARNEAFILDAPRR